MRRVSLTKKNGIDIMLSLFIIMVLFFPNVLVPIKLLLLVLLAINVRSGLRIINRELGIWLVILLAANIIFLTKGELAGTGAYSIYRNVYIIEPVLYFFILVPAFKYADLKKLEMVMLYTLMAVVIYVGLAFILFKLKIPLTFLQILPCELNANDYFGFIDIDAANTVSMLFVAPYFVMRFFSCRNKRRKRLIGMTIFGVIVVSLIIGRRAMVAVIVISFFMSWFLNQYILGNNKMTKVKSLRTVGLIFLILFTSMLMYQKLGSELRLGNLSGYLLSNSDSIRTQEVKDLLDAWIDTPFLGAGYGATANGNARSLIAGAYEYSYLAMLFQTGIFGSVCYILLIMWLFLKLFKIGGSKHLTADARELALAALVGLVCFLMANAMNPYLYSLDGLFYLFFSVGVCGRFEQEKTRTMMGQTYGRISYGRGENSSGLIGRI